MDIFQFCEQFPTIDHTLAYMRNRGLIRQVPPICGRNGCPRHLTQVKSASFPTDGFQWRCPTHKGRKTSIREGFFFIVSGYFKVLLGSFSTRAHFELRKGLMIAYCWALSMSLI
jgi:hypothetical protein